MVALETTDVSMSSMAGEKMSFLRALTKQAKDHVLEMVLQDMEEDILDERHADSSDGTEDEGEGRPEESSKSKAKKAETDAKVNVPKKATMAAPKKGKVKAGVVAKKGKARLVDGGRVDLGNIAEGSGKSAVPEFKAKGGSEGASTAAASEGVMAQSVDVVTGKLAAHLLLTEEDLSLRKDNRSEKATADTFRALPLDREEGTAAAGLHGVLAPIPPDTPTSVAVIAKRKAASPAQDAVLEPKRGRFSIPPSADLNDTRMASPTPNDISASRARKWVTAFSPVSKATTDKETITAPEESIDYFPLSPPPSDIDISLSQGTQPPRVSQESINSFGSNASMEATESMSGFARRRSWITHEGSHTMSRDDFPNVSMKARKGASSNFGSDGSDDDAPKAPFIQKQLFYPRQESASVRFDNLPLHQKAPMASAERQLFYPHQDSVSVRSDNPLHQAPKPHTREQAEYQPQTFALPIVRTSSLGSNAGASRIASGSSVGINRGASPHRGSHKKR